MTQGPTTPDSCMYPRDRKEAWMSTSYLDTYFIEEEDSSDIEEEFPSVPKDRVLEKHLVKAGFLKVMSCKRKASNLVSASLATEP